MTLDPWFATEPAMAGNTAGAVPVREILEGGPALDLLATAAGRRHGTDDPLLGASFLLKGYLSRLACAGTAALARDRRAPALTPGNLLMTFDGGRPQAVLLRVATPVGGSDRRLVARLHEQLVEQHCRPLVATLRRRLGAGPGWLWSNAAAAVASGWVETERIADPERVRALARAFHSLPGSPLEGRGTLAVKNGRLAFQRHACCLYIRVPDGERCDDCNLPGRGSGRS
ncbi:IucA/IucC family C-terminal-domain containing protein [Actinomadura decatromicini]|uniref:Aerobactin siderophore biosynthesis IucA/IucC-like C-terminal domain-containing protein n=1 Tax=Actinomadura decatromicini TaxID=2604572 RepID=A0A5D3F4W0_9ACTN|nr:IucA/IucC family C-terminal-domain containing protein [Actinomadura decatromicini]TYK43099.1 hypothetical protein FXF68_40180 [Actinomadura decatromicini]